MAALMAAQAIFPLLPLLWELLKLLFFAALIILGVLAVLIALRYILFHPYINSGLTIVLQGAAAFIWVRDYVLEDKSQIVSDPKLLALAGTLFFLVFIDCIHDLQRGRVYYGASFELLEFRSPYILKSIVSVLTLGLARAVFFALLLPCLMVWERIQLKRDMGRGPVRKYQPASDLRYGILPFYRSRLINRLEKKGKLLLNSHAATKELVLSFNKYLKLRPDRQEAIMPNINHLQDSGNYTAVWDWMLKELNLQESHCLAFMSQKKYKELQSVIPKAMSHRGCLPLSEIKYLPELTGLKLVPPLQGSSNDAARKQDRWLDFFILQALEPMVEAGEFEDMDLNDRDPLDNHAYRYKMSTKTMVSHDANSDPRLALDDW